MPLIHLTTFIQAPRDRLFQLSLSVDLHKYALKAYGAQAAAGIRNGLLALNDTVTWKAKHLMKERYWKVKVTQLKAPDYFVDEQLEGPFSMLKHEHYFKPIENGTFLIDQFRYEIKYGNIGKILNQLYLEKYLTRLLTEKNNTLKRIAESDQWKQFLAT